jgi:malate/lactate dehydrogenase
MTTNQKLFSVCPNLKQHLPSTKVTIVGSGRVASTIAYTLLLKGISDQVVIVDKSEDRLKAEFQDLLYGSYFFNENPNILGTTDFSAAKNSQVIIFAIDVAKIEGEEFDEFLQRNIDFYKITVPNVVQFCSDAIFIVVSATCDILSCEFCSLHFLFVHSNKKYLNRCYVEIIRAPKIECYWRWNEPRNSSISFINS